MGTVGVACAQGKRVLPKPAQPSRRPSSSLRTIRSRRAPCNSAIREAVTITNHGRDSLVLLSVEEYRRLKRRDREALEVSELSEQDIEAILAAEIPASTAAFDHELGT